MLMATPAYNKNTHWNSYMIELSSPKKYIHNKLMKLLKLTEKLNIFPVITNKIMMLTTSQKMCRKQKGEIRIIKGEIKMC